MIGQLTFWVSTKRHTATLSEQLAWECDEPEIEAYLTKTFPVRAAEGLSNLSVGRHLLYHTAERLGGHVQVPSKQVKRDTPEPV